MTQAITVADISRRQRPFNQYSGCFLLRPQRNRGIDARRSVSRKVCRCQPNEDKDETRRAECDRVHRLGLKEKFGQNP